VRITDLGDIDMDLKISKVAENGSIVLPDEIRKNLSITSGDSIALIYESNRVIIRKLTSGNGKMTVDEFILFRDIIIKKDNHKRVVKVFYGYLSSVTGDSRLLINKIGKIINIDVSALSLDKGCFNGIFDDTVPPYNDVDFYVRLSNGICVFVYGGIPQNPLKELKEYEYVIFLLSDDLGNKIERTNNYIFFRQ